MAIDATPATANKTDSIFFDMMRTLRKSVETVLKPDWLPLGHGLLTETIVSGEYDANCQCLSRFEMTSEIYENENCGHPRS